MPLDVQKIQAICFDVDGTIRDTDDQYMHALAHWLYPFRHLLFEFCQTILRQNYRH